MVEPTLLITVFDKILNVLGLIRGDRVERDEYVDSSLYALYAALAETKAYVVSLGKGEPHDQTKEIELAQLWHNASVPLRRIDPELARICFLKGGYWLEPEVWTEAMVHENQIALDDVFSKTRDLLIGK